MELIAEFITKLEFGIELLSNDSKCECLAPEVKISFMVIYIKLLVFDCEFVCHVRTMMYA